MSKNRVIMRLVLIDRSHFLSDNFNKGGFIMANKKLRGIARLDKNGSEVLLKYYITNLSGRYGIEIEKSIKDSSGNTTCCENYISEYNIDNCDKINNIADVFVENIVTPVTAECILHDLGLAN